MQRDPLGWMLWEGGRRWRTWTGILSALILLFMASRYVAESSQPGGGTGCGGGLSGEVFWPDMFGCSTGGVLNMLAAAVIPLGACLFAILEGSRLMAGLEKGGTLGLYLAYHPGRNRFLLTFYGALIIQLLGMGVVFWIIMNFAAWILNLEFGRGQLLANTMVCSLPAILFGTLAFSLGAATGRLWLSRWISSGAVLLISGWLAMAIFLPRFSFPGNKFLLQATRQPLFLLLCSLVLLGGGAWGFNRRDLQD